MISVLFGSIGYILTRFDYMKMVLTAIIVAIEGST